MKKIIIALALIAGPAFAESDQEFIDQMVSCYDTILQTSQGMCAVDLLQDINNRKPLDTDIVLPEGLDMKKVAMTLAWANACYSQDVVGTGMCKNLK